MATRAGSSEENGVVGLASYNAGQKLVVISKVQGPARAASDGEAR